MAQILSVSLCRSIQRWNADKARISTVRRFGGCLIGTLTVLWIFLAAHAVAQPPGSDPAHEELRMHGFHWMIGPKSGLGGTDEEFARLLKGVDENLAVNPCITAVYAIAHWRLIEPEPGSYRFERLDRLLASVRRHGRYYKLAVNPGIYSPDWLYAEGAAPFQTLGTNPARRDIYQKNVRIPIPWDPVYQQHYYRLLEEIGRRYGADPSFRAVAVTAATFMSPEWHLPRSKQDHKRWQGLEGFPQRLEQAWTNGIDRFSSLFPAQILVLEASSYPLGLRELGDSIVHHGATRYPGRFAVQINQLTGRFDQKRRPTYRKLLDYRSRYGEDIAIGLQNLKGWSFPAAARKQGSIEMSVYNFVQAGGEYWELWFGDGKEPATCEALRGALKKARKKDLAAYRYQLEDRHEYVADPGLGRLH